jgi:hypothetical protein
MQMSSTRITILLRSTGEIVASCGDFSGAVGPLDDSERFLIVSKHRDAHSQDCFRRANRCRSCSLGLGSFAPYRMRRLVPKGTQSRRWEYPTQIASDRNAFCELRTAHRVECSGYGRNCDLFDWSRTYWRDQDDGRVHGETQQAVSENSSRHKGFWAETSCFRV